MGIFDPFIDITGTYAEFQVKKAQLARDQVPQQYADPADIVAALLNATPADNVAAFLTDSAEEFILEDLEDAGTLAPEDVEQVADQIEGAATALLLGIGLAGTAVEGASLGQVDQHQEYLTQALAGLQVDDVTGLELEARTAEGLKPALNAFAGKRHRSKFVDVQDAVEYGLRTKDTDTGYLTLQDGSAEYVDAIGSNNQISSTNALEEWGLRDDQLRILEKVALNDMEFEELIETPAELGLIVPDSVLEDELDRAGYGENTKQFLSQVNDRIRKSARAYQELLITEDHISDLDTRVQDGTLSPQEAVNRVDDQVEIDDAELLQRWIQKDALPPSSPSKADFLDSLTSGYADLAETQQRLQQNQLDLTEYEDVLRAEILSEMDGSIRTARGLDLIDGQTFTDLADYVGLDDQAVADLQQGRDLDEIAIRRLQSQQQTPGLTLQDILQIGPNRAEALRSIGIQDVQDLANADVDDVATAIGVGQDFAQQLIDQANLRLSGGTT